MMYTRFLSNNEPPVERLKASRPVAWRVGIKYPSVKICVTSIGPETSQHGCRHERLALCWQSGGEGSLQSEVEGKAPVQRHCVLLSYIWQEIWWEIVRYHAIATILLWEPGLNSACLIQ